LLQVSKKDAVAELTRPVAGVLLTLMSNLSQTFRLADIADTLVHPADTVEPLSQYIAVLDDSSRAPPTLGKSVGDAVRCGGTRSAYAASFQVVLRGLLQHMIGCSECFSSHCFLLYTKFCRQCFDTVGWAAGRASGL